MKHQYLVLSIFLLICYSAVSGQKAYIFTDSTFKSGLNVIDKGNVANSAACYVQVGPKVKIYYPGEIKGYGLDDGTKFIAREIEINGAKQMVFLKQLTGGKASLYSYTDYKTQQFFLQKDSTVFAQLIKPEKNTDKLDYRQQIEEVVSDNPIMIKDVKSPNFNAKSLTNYIRKYNSKDSEFPEFKIAVTTSLSLTRLFFDSPYKYYDKLNTPPDKKDIPLNKIQYTYEPGLNVGLQFEKTFWDSNLSLVSGLYYSKNSFEYLFRTTTEFGSFKATVSTFNIPVLMKYSFSQGKVKPYMNTGIVYEINQNNSSHFIYQLKDASGNVIKTIDSFNQISKAMFGFEIGGGVSYKLNRNNSVFLEMRLESIYGSRDTNTLYQKEIQLVTGFSF